MKIAILYSSFLDDQGQHLKIGGIETYLQQLSILCTELGFDTTIYQWSVLSFMTSVNGVDVIGVDLSKIRMCHRAEALFQYVQKLLQVENDIIIFGSDQQSVRSEPYRSISIQHGVAWDLPSKYLTSKTIFHKGGFGRLYKTMLQWRFRIKYENCSHTVCVDNNFINWYRTQVPEAPRGSTWVIPNFASIASEDQIRIKKKKSKKHISILFARRFQEFRGTRIIAGSAKKILQEFRNASFTFAGEGPDEEWLKTFFGGHPRVSFLKYSPNESLKIHLEHDIAVVPSLASEGTSLSVAEAMGAGCAVVATNVGGITNMVLDRYNGLLVSPDEESLSHAIEELIRTPDLCDKISNSAYLVAKDSFSITVWKSRWREVLNYVKSSQ